MFWSLSIVGAGLCRVLGEVRRKPEAWSLKRPETLKPPTLVHQSLTGMRNSWHLCAPTCLPLARGLMYSL